MLYGDNMGVQEREIQQGGRITIPKDIREKYGLVEGTVVKITTRDGKIEIEPPTRLSKLIGLAKTINPSNDPKKEARKYQREKLLEEVK